MPNITITKDNQLVIPEDLSNITLAVIRPAVEQYREINKRLVFDYRSKEGNKQARSHVAKLRKIKSPVEAVHKSLKAEYKAITDAMDKDKRELLQIIEEMISVHAEPLKQIEEEEAEAALQERIRVEIEYCWDHAHELNSIFDQQKELQKQAAEQARIAEEQEAKQRDIERIEREREIAERAAREAKEKAEAEAERKAREEEAQRLEEEAKAAADIENVKRVHRAILSSLEDLFGVDCELAKSLIIAIREGRIPAVSIDYQWEREA